MGTLEFIQEHWKGKLITQSAPHFTLEGFDLSENTKHLLSKVGLPIILPIEKKILPTIYLFIQGTSSRQIILYHRRFFTKSLRCCIIGY